MKVEVGGSPELPVPNKPGGFCGREVTQKRKPSHQLRLTPSLFFVTKNDMQSNKQKPANDLPT